MYKLITAEKNSQQANLLKDSNAYKTYVNATQSLLNIAKIWNMQ